MKQMYNNILYEIKDDNCKILSSYRIKDRATMVDFCTYVLSSGDFAKRTVKSYVTEWRAHNLLYKLGLWRTRTQDTDLCANESKWKRFLYHILSIFYF